MKEEARSLVSLIVNIISSIALISLGFFGYLVSSDVRTIQKEADQRARAKQAQEFWNDMYVATQASDDKSGALGSAITKFVIASGELLNNYSRTYSSDTRNIVKDDPIYNASLASFFADYMNVLSKIEAVARDFDFLRLKYAALAQEHQLEGWGSFFNQTEHVRTWKEKVSTNMSTLYLTLFNGINNHTNPNELLRQMESVSSSIGDDLLSNVSVPYLKGLSEFIAVHIENVRPRMHTW